MTVCLKMNVQVKFKELIRRAANTSGLEIIRACNSPRFSLLGFSRLNIRTIIDIGANEGQFARQISTFFPRANLLCFQPLLEPFRNLSTWTEEQGY